ncbi:kinetochore-associated Ndc80 complex subunit NDC80 NDAI_0F00330 [Naumovozyma dairenensis CBS 421]|uniref:Kinetochore protein NDC80 n=1 Tax=Naumovozyma dairenensis (strain ATCC 10597 / BCRC 20456 / CBS 421 / NBRC 0211 / NRRL Y-12639) TaxID=1071378 RepID=G0WC41_NAUDC|nr:hypothetical protein NDAI_0F00330 [Naumovozyma dairenensis CBS 421]CCD25352.1 hypothetical protein NDAI_0F00330 [Naumovozyma dairenensis CBS 421]
MANVNITSSNDINRRGIQQQQQQQQQQHLQSQIPQFASSSNITNMKRRNSATTNSNINNNNNNMGLSELMNRGYMNNSDLLHSTTNNNNNNNNNKKRKARSTVASGRLNFNSTDQDGITNLRRRRRRSTSNNSIGTSIRQSTLPQQKRWSLNNNTSIGNSLLLFQSKSTTGTTTTTNRDPRPLRDKNFQNAIQQEIFDYLIENKFDLQTNHPISIKSLRQPTQKFFIILFKWLYNRLDQGYSFVSKSIENEVYHLLKNLQYPYLETINRSQISAVGGGTNWYKFLGMIHWLVKININLETSLTKLDEQNSLLKDNNTQDFTILNQPLKTLDEQDQRQEKYELIVEKLFIDYITESYQSFLKLEDNYQPYMIKLTNGFNKFIHIIEIDIKNLQLNNKSIFTKYQNLIEMSQKLKISKKKFNALQLDLTKFQNYINTMEFKSHEWPKKLERMNDERERKQQEIKSIELEISNLEKKLNDKNFSIENIDLKNERKNKLITQLDLLSIENDKLIVVLKNKKIECEKNFKNMINTINQYHTIIDNLILARNNISEHYRIKEKNNVETFEDRDKIKKDDLIIKIKSKYQDYITKGLINNIIEEGESEPESETDPTTFNYGTFFNNDIETFSINGTIRNHILKLNEQIQIQIESIQNENKQIEDSIAQLKHNINENNIINDSLEEDLFNLNSEFELNKQQNENDLITQRIEIEKFERKISDTKKEIDSKIISANQLVKSTKLKHQEFQRDITNQRESLQRKIIDIIEVATDFKFDIQKLIESKDIDITNLLKELDIDDFGSS